MSATVSGAGNRFVLFDGYEEALPVDPARTARSTRDADGLLLLSPGRAEGALRLDVINRDGSRPEACGNGLRCAAVVAWTRGYVPLGEVGIETVVGLRLVRPLVRAGTITGAVASMGVPRIETEPLRLELEPGLVITGAAVDMGNPHLVLRAADHAGFSLDGVAVLAQKHPRFPAGVNVGSTHLDKGGLRLRVWERGVGETRACGTGATAAAAVAIREGLARSPLAVEMDGGTLEVAWDGCTQAWLAGPVEMEQPRVTENPWKSE